MGFDIWDSAIHEDYEQIKRLSSAQKLSDKDVAVNAEALRCDISGSGAEPYHATLTDCTCPDFAFRKLPCKHIYRLAIELDLLPDLPIYSKSAAMAFDVDSEIHRFYQAYKSGAITGEKFSKIADAIKKGK